MTRSTLKNVRLIVPAIIFAVFIFILGQLLGYTSVKMPVNLKEAIYNIPLLVIAIAYYLSPLRNYANSRFHRRVNENIRARLVVIAGVQDDIDRYDWGKMKNIFYKIVDNDKSLEKRSEDIMFNGAIWTSAADVTALSGLFALFSAVLWALSFSGAASALGVFALIGAGSIVVQFAVTKKHIRMGNDQLDQIDQLHKSEVQAQVGAL